MGMLRGSRSPIEQGGPGLVRFGYGLGVERFERAVPAVPLHKVFFSPCFSAVQEERTVPVPASVPGKRFRRFRFRFRFRGKPVPTVPVSGSGSVPEPLCIEPL